MIINIGYCKRTGSVLYDQGYRSVDLRGDGEIGLTVLSGDRIGKRMSVNLGI